MTPKFLRKDVILHYNYQSEEKTASGIIIDHQEPEEQTAEIAFVGNKLEYLFEDKDGVVRTLKAGDKIRFKRAVAKKIKIEETTYLHINEDMVLYVEVDE